MAWDLDDVATASFVESASNPISCLSWTAASRGCLVLFNRQENGPNGIHLRLLPR